MPIDLASERAFEARYVEWRIYDVDETCLAWESVGRFGIWKGYAMRMQKLTMILLVAGLVGCPRTYELEDEIRQQDLEIESLERHLRQALEVSSAELLSADELDSLIDQVEDLARSANKLSDEIRQLKTERDSLQAEIEKLQTERQQLETEQRSEQ